MDVDEPQPSPARLDSEKESNDSDVPSAPPAFVRNRNEVVEDLTLEENIPTPGSSEGVQDGVPIIKPRPYQKEMVFESLKKNIIVAVSRTNVLRGGRLKHDSNIITLS